MIDGAHILLYSKDADADRAFFRDKLGLASVDAGGGWLIFALPPAEAGIHPAEGRSGIDHGGHRLLDAVLYLMCEDLPAAIQELEARGVACGEVQEEPWGVQTSIRLPSGGEVGLYQPRHATAIAM